MLHSFGAGGPAQSDAPFLSPQAPLGLLQPPPPRCAAGEAARGRRRRVQPTRRRHVSDLCSGGPGGARGARQPGAHAAGGHHAADRGHIRGQGARSPRRAAAAATRALRCPPRRSAPAASRRARMRAQGVRVAAACNALTRCTRRARPAVAPPPPLGCASARLVRDAVRDFGDRRRRGVCWRGRGAVHSQVFNGAWRRAAKPSLPRAACRSGCGAPPDARAARRCSSAPSSGKCWWAASRAATKQGCGCGPLSRRRLRRRGCSPCAARRRCRSAFSTTCMCPRSACKSRPNCTRARRAPQLARVCFAASLSRSDAPAAPPAAATRRRGCGGGGTRGKKRCSWTLTRKCACASSRCASRSAQPPPRRWRCCCRWREA